MARRSLGLGLAAAGFILFQITILTMLGYVLTRLPSSGDQNTAPMIALWGGLPAAVLFVVGVAFVNAAER